MSLQRPGAALLQSLVADELRGAPGPAREAALVAARSDPLGAVVHVLDAVGASLVAGEARAALSLLDGLPADTDPVVARRIHAYRCWAVQLDTNWYPGPTGGELLDATAEMPTLDEVAAGDPETRYLDAVAARGPVPMLSLLSLIESQGTSSAAGRQFGVIVDRHLDEFASVAEQVGVPTSAVWAVMAKADLARRFGLDDQAQQLLDTARTLCQQLGDPLGLARTYLVEGDWYATPGGTPEALGLVLQQLGRVHQAGSPDDGRAGGCYDAAGGLAGMTPPPRFDAALQLRRALLAARAGRHADAAYSLARARNSAASVGDAAMVHLCTMHALLAQIEAGDVAGTRALAGAGWGIDARGPLAEVARWGREQGSASFVTGLGRLAQRRAEAWRDDGRLDEAAAALSLAVGLIGASGQITPAPVLEAIASVDMQRGYAARAITRLEQAAALLPATPDPAVAPIAWMQQVDLSVAICGGQSDRASATPVRAGVGGLQRSLDRLRELVAASGVRVPPSAGTLRDRNQRLAALAAAHEGADMDRLLADAQRSDEEASAPFVDATLAAVVGQIVQTEVMMAVARARIARATGWEATASQWFTAAQDAASADSAHRWMAALVLGLQGRYDDAQAVTVAAAADAVLPDDLLAMLALRSHDWARATQWFGSSEPPPDAAWTAWCDRAELALETGDHGRALGLANRGIDAFEDVVGRLRRDPDRLATTDNVSVPTLYAVAARACLAGAAAEPSRAAAFRARFVQFLDRPRSLSTESLLDADADGDPAQRRWQELATDWSSCFDRLLASSSSDGSPERPALTAALTAADDALTAFEAQLQQAHPGWLTGRRLPRPLDVAAVQRALPRTACAVVFHVAMSRLLVAAVTTDEVLVAERPLAPGTLETLTNRVWRACEQGDPGPELDELANVVLGPVEGVVRAHERIVVVPGGPLSAVPFHLLPLDGAPLGEHHTVSVLPALALLSRLHVDGPLQGDGVTVVGDPAFTPGRPGAPRRLPGAAVEAGAVARCHAGSAVLTDAAATQAALEPLLPGRRIVHLAAHGRLDEVAPSTSAVILAGDDELTVAELIGRRIDAGLVVLSACDSGRGAATLGGDVVGLARGLVTAGVERSVVSLWPVDDASACVTMVAFHQHLAAGVPPARALAAAQREVRAMTADQLRARYAQLGGSPTDADRSIRRGGDAATPAGAIGLVLDDDPDFLPDEPAPAPTSATVPARLWAPFVLVGV